MIGLKLSLNLNYIAVPKPRINNEIRAPRVRVIDENGEMLGIMSSQEAYNSAQLRGLDLVEISPKADPPVVKILSFDKYRYQMKKAEAQQRKNVKKIDIKGIRISVRIGAHDLQFKADQAGKFLEKGDKVKVEMLLRGREKANVSYAFEIMEKFVAEVPGKPLIEQRPKKLGHMITAILAPAK